MGAADFRSQVQEALGSAYTIERELGGGGMSRVFLADETALGRRVVVKVLAPEMAEGLNAERFSREVRLAARLQHPNILPVFATGAAGGTPYYTMPYVEGESLRSRLARDGAPSITDAITILRDVARALASAHDQGVVHRDVKPDNILLSRDAAVVADFGIAKAISAARGEEGARTGDGAGALTVAGMSLGTPAYMAPEQAAGDPDVDHRADLYAWGVVAYELLAGRHPFAGKSSGQAYIVAHLVEIPAALDSTRSGLPAPLAALVMRCLAKVPAERPASARDLVDALAGLTSTSGAHGSAVQPTIPSIAVLPFVNLSADPDNEYFSDGISEEVLSALARDPGLRVAARSSSFALKGKDVPLRAIAERLHVSTVLEGSVRRVGNRVRITAQLVNAADGYQLWNDKFDRELTDIFAVQDEIASAIADTLARRLREAAGEKPTPPNAPVAAQPAKRTRQRIDVEAYDEYLKGRHANRDMRGVGHEAAPAHFERALALEPKFAEAHAGLGESYLWMAIFFAVPPWEAFSRVRRHAQRAMAIDPELADAHWLMAEVAYWYDWDEQTSTVHIEHALALEPRHSGALMTSALLNNSCGRRTEALSAAAAAVQADPLGLGTRVWFLAVAFNGEHESDLVISEATRLIAEQPAYGEAYRWRAMARMIAGDLSGAEADFDKAGELNAGHLWWRVGMAALASQQGNFAEVRRVRDELVALGKTTRVSPMALGQVEQALGDYDAALAYYERGYESRDFLMTVMHTDPQFRLIPPGKKTPIQDDLRWADIVRRVGMAP